MKEELNKGVNYASLLGMVFFMLVALYFAAEYHKIKNDCLSTFDKNDYLYQENKALKHQLKSCEEEKTRWFNRWNQEKNK